MFDDKSVVPNKAQVHDPEDYSFPRWRIDRNSGLFVNDMMGTEREIIQAILLGWDKSRILWPEYGKDNGNKLPKCYSINGVFPVNQSDSNPYGRRDEAGRIWCTGCPKSSWDFGKPECAITYNYLLLDMDDEMPGVLNLARTRVKVAKSLNGFHRLNTLGGRPKRWVQLYTEQEDTDFGKIWGVKFQRGELLSQDWQDTAQEMMAQVQHFVLTGDMRGDWDNAGPDTEPGPTAALTEPTINPETGEVYE